MTQSLPLSSLLEVEQRLLLLDAPGGSRETLCMNFILARRKTTLATALSSIAATLAEGGRMVHSTSELPLDAHHHGRSVVSISATSAKVVRFNNAVRLFGISAQWIAKSLSRLSKDLRSTNTILFGGVLALLVGDSRQTLPAIPRSMMSLMHGSSSRT